MTMKQDRKAERRSAPKTTTSGKTAEEPPIVDEPAVEIPAYADLDLIEIGITGVQTLESYLDAGTENVERMVWAHWTDKDYAATLAVLGRVESDARRTKEKLLARKQKTDAIIAEARVREGQGEKIPKPGDVIYIPPSDDIYGGQAVVHKIHFSLCKTSEKYARILVSFVGIFQDGLAFDLEDLMEKQDSLKKMYGEEKAKTRGMI